MQRDPRAWLWDARMFLRCNRRLKDGKRHDYWSVVENRRLADGRVVQRQVLYLGEINASRAPGMSLVHNGAGDSEVGRRKIACA
jgi:hypothetical protein